MRQTERLAGFGGQATTDNQRDTATGADLIQQHIGFQFKCRQQFIGVMIADLTFIRVNVDHIPHIQVADIHFHRQSTRIFHRVEENRGNFAAQHNTAAALVRYIRDIIPHKPQHRVSRGFTGRAGTDHITDIGQREPFFAEQINLINRTDIARLIRINTVTRVFQHRECMQRDIRTRPGIRCR